MDHTSFDSLARQTTSAVSRRRSLMTLGMAGLAAALAGPLAAAAKTKGGKKKKKNKKQRSVPTALDFCGPQVAECTTVLTNLIGDNPDSPASIACCSSLATCDFTQFFACLLIESEN